MMEGMAPGFDIALVENLCKDRLDDWPGELVS